MENSLTAWLRFLPSLTPRQGNKNFEGNKNAWRTEYKLNPSASFATSVFGDVTAPIATEGDCYLETPPLIFTWSRSATAPEPAALLASLRAAEHEYSAKVQKPLNC